MREIETKRLFLRKLRSDDAESIFRNWASDSEVANYVTWNVHKDMNETKAICGLRNMITTNVTVTALRIRLTGSL